MNNIIYLIGLVVVVVAILGFFGSRPRFDVQLESSRFRYAGPPLT